MKSVIWSLVCVVGLYGATLASASPAGPQEPGAITASDKMLDERVEKRLNSDSSLKKYDIDVEVSGGVVKLTGSVATAAQKTKAGRLANVSGVKSIDNQIVVDPNAGSKGTMGTIKEKTKEGAVKTKEGAVKVGEKTKEGAVKVGNEITDAWILTRVKSRFVGEDVMKGSDINVDVDKHIVTLRGTVPTEAARARAIEIAKTTEGVKNVVDRLTIAPKK